VQKRLNLIESVPTAMFSHVMSLLYTNVFSYSRLMKFRKILDIH